MSFRKDFIWGAATASYQIEGAAYEEGKGTNIWDEFTKKEGKIFDGSSGTVACDHYHRFKEDVKLMSELGLKAYRFSISWSRILPNGEGEINQKGIDFYNALINELLNYGIEPYVTLFHWDLPTALHLKGGWLNAQSSEWFAQYTKVVAENFGDRVKNFITFNEPQVFIGCGYQTGEHAPGCQASVGELLQMGHNVLKSHGKAVRVLRKLVPEVKIGFTMASIAHVPISEHDVEKVKNAYFSCGRYHFVFTESYWFDPIVFGKYPENILSECADILPEIMQGDMELISEKIDFLGLNIYTGVWKQADETGSVANGEWAVGQARTAIGWNVIPEALYWGTRYHYERYRMPIYITENGMSAHDWISLDGKVHDPNRIDFLHRYIKELKRSAMDGTDIRGYFQWSLMDNFEWARGYAERFGLIYVDYTTQQRIIKDSGFWYRDIIEKNGELL